MSRLRYRRGAIFRGGIGDDAPVPAAVDSTILEAIDLRTKSILSAIEEQNHARKWALMIAGASALFAAVKLGLIVVPHLRRGGGE